MPHHNTDSQDLANFELDKEARMGDMEKKNGGYQETVVQAGDHHHSGEATVQRRLKSRHLAMIALGGTIGTGLFVGSGQALASGGPVGTLLGYAIVGLVVYSMMIALGEMATLFPDSGGFTHYATRFLDPSLGFALGYNYWYSYAITLPTELTAAAIVIQYWNQTINVGAWIAPLFVAIIVINFLGVRAYGEMEFWFSAMKIVAIVGLIILGICLDCGAGPKSSGYIGFRYWKHPGPFAQFASGDVTVGGTWGRFLAFWNVFVQAAFSYIGTEIVAVTVGEAANPRKTVPKAIRRVFYRILLFYVLAIFIIGLLVPYNDDRLLNGTSKASTSPFVIAIVDAGIKGLPSVINAVLLISAWSAGNSDLYAASRTLYALALEGKAPAVFRKCTKDGLPVWCVAITSVFGLLAFMNCGNESASVVFNWLYNISAITGLITWMLILASYLRFYYGMKRQGLSRDDLPYKSPFQPYASYFGFVMIFLIILFNGFPVFISGQFSASKFFAAYVCLLIFFAFWLPYKLFGGDRTTRQGWFAPTRFVRLDEMDFETGRREMDEMDRMEQDKYSAPESTWEKIMNALF